jgi:HSP20 family protein
MTTQLLVPRRHTQAQAVAWSDFDRLFDQLWRGVGSVRASAAAFTPRIDVTESDSELCVAAELPGLDEKDIEVSLEDGLLTIRGERSAEEQGEDTPGVRHRETFRGKFQRVLRLPSEVDTEAVTAVYRNGILNVTLPKTPTARVRNIPITGAA